MTTPALDDRSKAFRRTILRSFHAAGRGHLPSALSLVEILRVLYDDVLRYDASRPRWPARDRFILSKGHGCLALYAILAEKGFFPEGELWKVGQADGILGGHPDAGKVPGVEVSTGSLGHGLSVGEGMALHAQARGTGVRVFVVLSDGECQEGSVWEAAMSAAQHRLENLTVLVDCNGMQSFGPVSAVQDVEPLAEKWRAFGWSADEVDGHDVSALRDAVKRLPLEAGRPTAILCRTVKGKGIASIDNDPTWHHRTRVSDEDIARLSAELE